MKLGGIEFNIFWLVMTGIMLIGFTVIDELPIKIFKIIVLAFLTIYVAERIFLESDRIEYHRRKKLKCLTS